MRSQEETTILGLFEEITEAATALNHLLGEAGRAREDLMVLSSVPFPEGVLDVDRSKSRLPLLTLFFAFVGIGLGLLVAGGSQLLYVLQQGGKPILPGPPIAIITYEIMMLVALSGAFLTALYEMRLPAWRARVYDSRISEGYIGIAAHCANAEQADQAAALMDEAGAAFVQRDARRFE